MAEIEYLGPLDAKTSKDDGVEYLGPLQRAADVKNSALKWSEVPSEALSNVGGSAANYGKSLIHPILHPIDTVTALKDIAVGGAGKVLPVSDEEQGQKFDAVVDYFRNRYGSEDALKKAISTDPVGVLADLSTVFTGGGGAVAKIGTLTGAAKVAKAGQITSRVGNAVEPLSIAGKAVAPVAKLGGEIAAGTLGFTTGSGKASIQQATKGGKEFTDAMRGKISGEDILSNTKGALQAIKEDRANTYLPRLEELSKNVTQLDITPVRNQLSILEKSFNIKRGPKGELDFSRSTINKNSIGDTKEVIEMVDGWLLDPAYQTPVGLDILKRKLGDFYSESSNSRALVTSLKNKVKSVIIKEVPEYAKMVGDYEKSSNFIDEITRTLSVGNKATADTGIRKLMTALKDNYDFRKELIGKIDEAAGSNLQSQIAGYNLSGITPQGFMGKTFDTGVILGALMQQDPRIAFALTAASPRVVGEFANAFGKMYRAQKKLQEIANPSVRQTAFQAGRMATPKPAMTED